MDDSDQPDYVLVPNPDGGYTKMERATAEDVGATFVEVPNDGTPKQMVKPVYDASQSVWSDSVATQQAVNNLNQQVIASNDLPNAAAFALQSLALAISAKMTSTPITDWANRIKSYRTLDGSGGWNDAHVGEAVTVGWITVDEYADITAKSYVGPTEGA